MSVGDETGQHFSRGQVVHFDTVQRGDFESLGVVHGEQTIRWSPKIDESCGGGGGGRWWWWWCGLWRIYRIFPSVQSKILDLPGQDKGGGREDHLLHRQ